MRLRTLGIVVGGAGNTPGEGCGEAGYKVGSVSYGEAGFKVYRIWCGVECNNGAKGGGDRWASGEFGG